MGFKELKAINDKRLSMENILKARERIVDYTKGENNVSGVTDCPMCKNQNSLNFCVQNNHHIHAKCETDGCVQWME